jgi:hypothetical protein
MGVAPVRVDILMALPGVEFSSAWQNKSVADFEQIKVYIIGKKELLIAKKNTTRNVDKIDIGSLKKTLKG